MSHYDTWLIMVKLENVQKKTKTYHFITQRYFPYVVKEKPNKTNKKKTPHHPLQMGTLNTAL